MIMRLKALLLAGISLPFIKPAVIFLAVAFLFFWLTGNSLWGIGRALPYFINLFSNIAMGALDIFSGALFKVLEWLGLIFLTLSKLDWEGWVFGKIFRFLGTQFIRQSQSGRALLAKAVRLERDFSSLVRKKVEPLFQYLTSKGEKLRAQGEEKRHDLIKQRQQR